MKIMIALAVAALVVAFLPVSSQITHAHDPSLVAASFVHDDSVLGYLPVFVQYEDGKFLQLRSGHAEDLLPTVAACRAKIVELSKGNKPKGVDYHGGCLLIPVPGKDDSEPEEEAPANPDNEA